MFLFLLLLTAGAGAQTSLKVFRGWGGKERTGRWNPLFVRVSDPAARNVKLQVISPTEGGFANIIEENIAIGPSPATFELLSPSHYSAWQRTVIVLRDGATGKFLAQSPQHLRDSTPEVAAVGPQQLFIGITGRRMTMEPTIGYLGGHAGYLPPVQVPRTSLGFDSLDVLLLNRPNLRELEPDQQQAILNWIGAGGSLLFIPGEDPVPTDSPLAAALPCHLGGVRTLDLTQQNLKASHLLTTASHLLVRQLQPLAGSSEVELIKGSAVMGVLGRYGLGRVMVSPVDLSTIQFDEAIEKQASIDFWQPIIQPLVEAPSQPQRQTFSAPYFGYQSETPEQQREGAATATVCDFLAPSRPQRISWSSWAMMVLGILIVLGPLDSLVLKATGRRAWTWSTLPAWMGLAALAAALIGSSASKSTTSIRTVRVIDQAGDRSIANVEMLGCESSGLQLLPSTATSGWWEPALPGNIDPQLVRTQPDLRFHENDQSCPPQGISPSSQPRFLRSQAEQAGPPVLRASLLLTAPTAASPARLTGTISNISKQPVTDLHIRTASGVLSVPLESGSSLAPGQEVKVDFITNTAKPFDISELESRYQNYGFFGNRTYATPVKEQELWAVVGDLAARRSLRIDQLLAGGGFACIYAQTVDPKPPVEFSGIAGREPAYYEWVRAVVPLGQ